MNIDETVNPYGITHGEYRKQNCYDIAAGVFPFLLSGTAFMLVEAPQHLSFIPDFLRSFILVFLCYWLLIAGVAFASWKSWPRWSYPYAGYVLIFFLYTLSLRMPGREYVLLITGSCFMSSSLPFLLQAGILFLWLSFSRTCGMTGRTILLRCMVSFPFMDFSCLMR